MSYQLSIQLMLGKYVVMLSCTPFQFYPLIGKIKNSFRIYPVSLVWKKDGPSNS